jgi:hypothetical protein
MGCRQRCESSGRAAARERTGGRAAQHPPGRARRGCCCASSWRGHPPAERPPQGRRLQRLFTRREGTGGGSGSVDSGQQRQRREPGDGRSQALLGPCFRLGPRHVRLTSLQDRLALGASCALGSRHGCQASQACVCRLAGCSVAADQLTWALHPGRLRDRCAKRCCWRFTDALKIGGLRAGLLPMYDVFQQYPPDGRMQGPLGQLPSLKGFRGTAAVPQSIYLCGMATTIITS